MNIITYVFQIAYWLPDIHKKMYGFKILLFRFIGFTFEFGNNENNTDHIHVSLTIWKVWFTYQITIDWRE